MSTPQVKPVKQVKPLGSFRLEQIIQHVNEYDVDQLLELSEGITAVLQERFSHKGAIDVEQKREMASSGMKQYEVTICTEENPQLAEVRFILEHLDIPCRVSKLTSDITNNKWNGKFIAETDTDQVKVEIQLVKGCGSFIDYVVYDHLNPDEEKSTPILLLESTKTCDGESRNTMIYQRLIKFVVARNRFPDTPLVMFYNTEQEMHTQTNQFAGRLLKTLDVKAYDKTNRDLLEDFAPFMSADELIKEKETIKRKSQNVSVNIQHVGNQYIISAKLSKGKQYTICHDPNKGMITGLASAIHKLDADATFRITEHHVSVDMINRQKDKCKQKDKFWYANSAYDLQLEGSTLSSKGVNPPPNYWIKDQTSEKAATINYHHHMETMGWTTVFHNHSSSARSYFIDEKGDDYAVPKIITIPDVVMVNKESKHIQICEGKIWKARQLGEKQLDDLTDFKRYTEERYPGYTIMLGLCLYVSTLSEIEKEKEKLRYPIFFAMDSNGNLLY